MDGKGFNDGAFQIDSAATCNTIPDELFRQLGNDHKLSKSTSTSVTYAGKSVQARGLIELLCGLRCERSERLSLEVVDLHGKPEPLGLPDSIRLSLSLSFLFIRSMVINTDNSRRVSLCQRRFIHRGSPGPWLKKLFFVTQLRP